jgi:ADP-dependent NAD(P)H-hydrate dehydratase / NAD(P)H-hydrate epimerase
MLYALTAAQMRAVEERTVAETGLDLAELMERAGSAVAADAAAGAPAGRIVVVAGKGNNGGDGWVAARELQASGRDVLVVTLADPGSLAEPASRAASSAIEVGVSWMQPSSDEELVNALDGAALIVDALFGFGFRGPAREPYARAITAVNDADAAVLAVDVPSGVEADTGRVTDAAVRADMTVTFTAPKIGLVSFPGAGYAGEVRVADIGVPARFVDEAGDVELWDSADQLDVFPFAEPDANKGSRGRLLVVAGSRGMTGSVALAASAALRTGAGYVTLACADSLIETLACKLTPVVLRPLPERSPGELAEEAADAVLELTVGYDAVVLGPGLTTREAPSAVARRLVRELTVPLLVDADALNALAAAGEAGALMARTAPTVLTPHPGEMARLLGTGVADVQADRLAAAARLSSERTVCVLKGASTVVSGQGRRLVVTSGNAGMATLGTGDVLSGMIGALLAQGLSPFDAGALGAHLHGAAGDAAAAELTETCVTAEDVLGHIPSAVGALLGW